jgi:succinoglycan biosynthesis protein ExoL
MRVSYFAHDLSDAAVVRRVQMLRDGGADVKLLGFRRTATPIHAIDGVAAIDLGQTFDGRLISRFAQVLRCSLTAWRLRETINGSNILLARNLEMATIANAVRLWARSHVRLAYECLDIHSAQLGKGLPSKLLREWEKQILRRSSTLIVSSPSFLSNYFHTLGVRIPEVILAENKRVLSNIERPRSSSDRQRPPWRIGWFGNLRCVKSFWILKEAAEHDPCLIDVELRGRPTSEMQDLISRHLPLVNMRFGGPYTPADLATMYGACDFTWAIEYAGQNAQNARWALGNRLYEGSFYNSPVLVLAHTAMGDWLRNRQAGVLLNDPGVELAPFLMNLTAEQYRGLQRASADIPTRDLVWTTKDRQEFVCRLAGGERIRQCSLSSP